MIHLYPPVSVRGQNFSNVKKVVVPKQSLSLREILRRYVRREPLPGVSEGVYEERFGDLEKMAKADIVDQMEFVEDLKGKIARVKKRESDRLIAVEAAKKESARIAAATATPPTPTPTLPTQPVSG